MKFNSVSKVSLFLVLSLVLLFPTAMAGDWNVNIVDTPNNIFDISDGEKSIILVKLTDQNGDPVTESDVSGSSGFYFYYNQSQGAAQNMTHWRNSVWYAEFDGDFDKHIQSSHAGDILFEAVKVSDPSGDTPPQPPSVTEKSKTLNLGDYVVKVRSGLSGEIFAGESMNLQVRVEGRTDGNFIEEPGEITGYFTNETWSSKAYSFSESSGGNYFVSDNLQAPMEAGETYILRLVAADRSADYQIGSLARKVTTSPDLEAELSEFSSDSGCEQRQLGLLCNAGANITTDVDVTSAQANSVEISLYKTEKGTGSEELIFSRTMGQNNDLYTEEFMVPEIDKSIYDNNLTLEINATNDNQYYEIEKYFFYNGTASNDSGGGDDGNNSDGGEGDGGDQDSLLSAEDKEFFKQERGEETYNLQVTEQKNSQLQVTTSISSNLEEHMNVSEEGSFSLSPGETRSVNVTVGEIDLNQTIEGHINLTASAFTETVRVNITTPGCEFTNGSLCAVDSKWLNVSARDREQRVRDLEIYYTAGGGERTNLTVNKYGDISEYIELNRSELVIEDSAKINLTFTPSKRGNFTGGVLFRTDNGTELTYLTALEADVIERSGVLNTNVTSYDIGAVPQDSSRSFAVELNNSANFSIDNLQISSGTNEVAISENGTSIESEDEKTVTITLNNIQSLGRLTITGQGVEEDVSIRLDVQGTVVEDYTERLSLLRAQLRQVMPVEKQNLTETSSEVQELIGQVEEQWENGQYLEAKSSFQEAEAKIAYMENNKAEEQDGQEEDQDDQDQQDQDEDSETEDGTDADGGSDQSQGADDQTGSDQQKEVGGGLPVIPIAVMVFLIFLGFVFYESYIPEEGDPLYGVRGEP